MRAPAGADLLAISRSLQQRNVSVSLRGSSLRIAPHVYNDAADTSALLEVLAEHAG